MLGPVELFFVCGSLSMACYLLVISTVAVSEGAAWISRQLQGNSVSATSAAAFGGLIDMTIISSSTSSSGSDEKLAYNGWKKAGGRAVRVVDAADLLSEASAHSRRSIAPASSPLLVPVASGPHLHL
ncbi:hypothetical protein Esti_003523 [Eimeria stiedai]